MKTLTSFASTLAAMASLTFVACSSGDDVYVRDPNSTTSTTAPLECTITPGADMCGRTIPSVPAAEHARVLAALRPISNFAWVADRMMVAITGACRTIAEETGARPYGVDATARSCTTPNGKPTRVCEPGKVTVVPGPGATYSANAVGNALSRHLGEVLALKETLESLLLPEGCITPATKLATQSVARIQAVVTAMNQLADAAAAVQ